MQRYYCGLIAFLIVGGKATSLVAIKYNFLPGVEAKYLDAVCS